MARLGLSEDTSFAHGPKIHAAGPISPFPGQGRIPETTTRDNKLEVRGPLSALTRLGSDCTSVAGSDERPGCWGAWTGVVGCEVPCGWTASHHLQLLVAATLAANGELFRGAAAAPCLHVVALLPVSVLHSIFEENHESEATCVSPKVKNANGE